MPDDFFVHFCDRVFVTLSVPGTEKQSCRVPAFFSRKTLSLSRPLSYRSSCRRFYCPAKPSAECQYKTGAVSVWTSAEASKNSLSLPVRFWRQKAADKTRRDECLRRQQPFKLYKSLFLKWSNESLTALRDLSEQHLQLKTCMIAGPNFRQSTHFLSIPFLT